MWAAQTQELDSTDGVRIALTLSGEVLAARAVFEAWRENEPFRTFFDELLGRAPFEAFYFETPPVTRDTLDRPFEMVLLRAPALAAAGVDVSPFREHFRHAPPEADVVTFANLSGDAQLVVPCPLVAHTVYAHLAVFSRAAPRAQRQALWKEVGHSLERNLQTRPTWLSTAGGGVFWLHVRLDSRPKYLRHEPYRRWPRGGSPSPHGRPGV